MSSSLLSICIPTCNRAHFLQDCLRELIPWVQPYKIPICISDNASTDRTPQIIEEFAKEYPNIIYFRNQVNSGPDANFAKVLRMAPTKYAWLLGDDDRIVGPQIAKLLMVLSQNEYDLVVVNGGRITKNGLVIGRVRDFPCSTDYYDRNKLMADLGWHMTWMSCLIFGEKLIKEGNFERYYDTNFLQFAVIFDYFADKKILVHWHAEPAIYNVNLEEPGWFFEVFEVWAKRWCEIFDKLPTGYYEAAIKKCRLDHGVKSRVFSLFYFIGFRLLNYYNFHIYRKYRRYFPLVTNLNNALLFLISLLPVPPFLAGYLRSHLRHYYELVSEIKYRGQ